MRKEGHELVGMKERTEGQSSEGGGCEQGSCCLPLYLLSEVHGGWLFGGGSCSERQPFFNPDPR